MKKLILAFVVFASVQIANGQNVPQKLSEKVTVVFPTKPAERSANGATIFLQQIRTAQNLTVLWYLI